MPLRPAAKWQQQRWDCGCVSGDRRAAASSETGRTGGRAGVSESALHELPFCIRQIDHQNKNFGGVWKKWNEALRTPVQCWLDYRVETIVGLPVALHENENEMKDRD